MQCACTERDGAIIKLCMAHHWAFCANLIAELGDLHGILVSCEHELSEAAAAAAAGKLHHWVKTWTPRKVGDATRLMWDPPPEAEAL